MTVGPIAALTYAVGEQLNLLAGVRLTRLAAAAKQGDAELVVERSVGMDDAGTVVVDGVTYSYGALVDGALRDLSVTTPQGTFAGVYQDHALNAVVTDANRDYSALDAVRRSLFVSTAEGEDLSLLGRILGVPREPAVADDTQYRSLIRAIAYNPRTTLQGLTTALDALVGPGNYAVVEDPINYPATVLVYLSGADLVGSQCQGRAFLAADEAVSSLAGVVSLAAPAMHLGALHLAPVSFWVTFGAAKPSAAATDDAGAQIPGSFVFVGDESHVAPYALGPGQSAQQLATSGYYRFATPLTPASLWRAALRALVPDATRLSATDARGLGLRVRTTAATFGLGCVLASDGTVGLGLANLSDQGGSLLAGIGARVAANTPFEAALALDGSGQVQFWLNNRLVQTLPQSAAAIAEAHSATGFDLGAFNGSPSQAVVQAAGINSSDPTDYNSTFGSATRQNTNVLALSFAPQADDVGRAIRVISGGGSALSQNQARDSYPILAVDPAAKTVTVGGKDLGRVDLAQNVLFCSGSESPLTYPDDVGRKVTLSDSLLGNNGTYTISAILDVDGTSTLSRAPGALPVRSPYAVLSPAPPRTETQVSASLAPNFGSAPALVQLVGTWQSVDDTAFSPRSALPFDPAAYTATVSHVLSAQVYDDLGAVNYRTSEGPPPRYVIWPLYLTDPTFFVQTYLQDMLAAGVRLKIMAGLEDMA